MSFLKSRMVRFCLAEIILAVIIITAYFYYKDYQKSVITFAPFATSANGLTLNSITSAPIMEGTPEGDLMIAAPEGSKIFAKGGLNYVIGNSGADEFYYSLCSTKIIDNKINVLENFDPKNDKLKIFCAHHAIQQSDVSVVHSIHEGVDITYVIIKGEHSDSAIALIGNIDLKQTNIVLNERWSGK